MVPPATLTVTDPFELLKQAGCVIVPVAAVSVAGCVIVTGIEVLHPF
jgi:hypothetical protein